MTDISKIRDASYPAGFAVSARAAAMLPPAMALAYPWAVWCFYNAVVAMRAVEGSQKILPLLAAIVALGLAAVPSLVSYLMLLRPVARQDRFAGTRWISYLAFAAPAFFTVERVVFAGLRSQLDDRLIWVPIWAALVVVAGVGRPARIASQPAWTGRLRAAHGVSAALILVSFLLVHLGNHFVGLLGPEVHRDVMQALRGWYRADLVEWALVALFLFQMVSGARLAAIRQLAQGDAFRTLQVATGVGLMAFLLAHMTVIFIVARWENGIDTDWVFATGFKIGMLGNLSNARQVPYYGFALVTTITHLACGLRVVLLAHGWRQAAVNRIALALMAGGAALATAILAGMLGVRLG
jgi:hypothetical protein